MSSFVLAQILATIGFAFDVTSHQFRKRDHAVIALGLGSIFIATHFYVMDQLTASAMFSLAAIRHFISIRYRSKKLYAVFVSGTLFATFLTYTSYMSVLSCVANLLMTSGSFSPGQKQLRLLLMAGSAV
mgnify:CR=1 FL=1|jgi:hypothetical protein